MRLLSDGETNLNRNLKKDLWLLPEKVNKQIENKWKKVERVM